MQALRPLTPELIAQTLEKRVDRVVFAPISRHGFTLPTSYKDNKPENYLMTIRSSDHESVQKITLIHETIHVINNHRGFLLESGDHERVERLANEFCAKHPEYVDSLYQSHGPAISRR